jgi:hypothetical protein
LGFILTRDGQDTQNKFQHFVWKPTRSDRIPLVLGQGDLIADSGIDPARFRQFVGGDRLDAGQGKAVVRNPFEELNMARA